MAPILAIRALALLHTAEAVEPLLGQLLEGFEDDWLINELVSALSRIGSPDLPVLVRVLEDGHAAGLARNGDWTWRCGSASPPVPRKKAPAGAGS